MKALLAGLLLLSGAAPAAGREAARTIPLRLIDGRLFVPVTVGETQTLALLDSTAAETVIDDDFARRLGISEPRAIPDPDSRMSIEEIERQMALALESHVSVELGLYAFGASMPHVELGLVGGIPSPPLDLAIGADHFYFPAYRIDIAGGTLALASEPPARGVRLPVTGAEQRRPTFPVAIGPLRARASIDTGRAEVGIARAFADRAGLLGAGTIGVRSVLLPEFNLAGRTFRGVEAVIDERGEAADLSLGTSILRHFLVTTYFFENAIWLEPRS